MNDTTKDYMKFVFMLITAMMAIFGISYLNTFDSSHVYWSESRYYMTLLMGATLGIVFMVFMQKYYRKKSATITIYLSSMIVFIVTLGLMRTQVAINDTDYLKSVIPNHSASMLSSERAIIQDYRVKRIANEIQSQHQQQIEQMAWLINDIEENGIVKTYYESLQRPIPDTYFKPRVDNLENTNDLLSE
ncbi:MAG: DUF305 domain-containing protein [Halobacteriovoraceae bacterium]|nr:DUF305 domain-containing protein [Halobacteriovoraceae bacterium]|tara:strand:- start:7722 stop:8288 length:567 start_codon:yes stop_codon:yes gene_type:complete